MRPKAPGARPPRGFVLAVTLWLLAGIAVVVGLMTWWAREQVQEAIAEREAVEERVATVSTRETLLYLAATRDLTFGGLPVAGLSPAERAMRQLEDLGSMRRDALGDELRLDGRAYHGFGGVRFSLQDEAGLFSVVLPDAVATDRFLSERGVPADAVPRLRDALLDYIDEDDLARLNGAESREYGRDGRPPPPGRRLRLPMELLEVAGWSDLPDELAVTLPGAVTPYYAGAVNLNTVPEALLPQWLPGCPETCRVFARRRDEAPFVSSLDVAARVGTSPRGDPFTDYRFVAADTLRLTFWKGAGMAWRMHVRLTPLADKAAPWSVLAAYPVSRSHDDAPALPVEGDLFAHPPSR